MIGDRDSKDFITNPGDTVRVIYSSKVDDRGVISIFESGYEDIQEAINADRDFAEPAVLVRRFMASGDTSLLMRRIGEYGDFRRMPKTYAEALQLQLDSRALYDSLPSSVKEQFNNDVNQFFATTGSPEWLKKMNDFLPENMRIVEKEVTTDA